jgi:hypothetical protein
VPRVELCCAAKLPYFMQSLSDFHSPVFERHFSVQSESEPARSLRGCFIGGGKLSGAKTVLTCYEYLFTSIYEGNKFGKAFCHKTTEKPVSSVPASSSESPAAPSPPAASSPRQLGPRRRLPVSAVSASSSESPSAPSPPAAPSPRRRRPRQRRPRQQLRVPVSSAPVGAFRSAPSASAPFPSGAAAPYRQQAPRQRTSIVADR